MITSNPRIESLLEAENELPIVYASVELPPDTNPKTAVEFFHSFPLDIFYWPIVKRNEVLETDSDEVLELWMQKGWILTDYEHQVYVLEKADFSKTGVYEPGVYKMRTLAVPTEESNLKLSYIAEYNVMVEPNGRVYFNLVGKLDGIGSIQVKLINMFASTFLKTLINPLFKYGEVERILQLERAEIRQNGFIEKPILFAINNILKARKVYLES